MTQIYIGIQIQIVDHAFGRIFEKLVKMMVFDVFVIPKLISRKIWPSGKFFNFNICKMECLNSEHCIYLSALILMIPSWSGMSIAAKTSSAPPSTLLSSSGFAELALAVAEAGRGEVGLASARISAAILDLSCTNCRLECHVKDE